MSFKTVSSDDGSMFACIGRRVNVFSAASGERVLSSRPFPDPSYAAFSPTNRELALAFTDGRVLIVDLPEGNVMRDLKKQKEGEGTEIFFSPDGTQLIHGIRKGLVAKREVQGKGVDTRQFPGEMIDRLSTDSLKRLWLIEHRSILRSEQELRDWDYLALYKWPLFSHEPKLFAMKLYMESATISPDGTRICLICWSRGEKKKVRILQISDGTFLSHVADYETGGTGSEIAWSADSTLIGVVQKERFVFYQASELEMIADLPCRYPSSICFLPNQDLVVLGTWNASVLASVPDVLKGKVKLK
ncbi:WD40 repeat domain-containing protein [Occallatibacter savannae]|uniref:WD40 repeat domain-containing protein n=1 Tax=Occallatibacter savannae TaxID=1002691 RepID=UPI000D69FF2C|nr:WD40 repeat domain-containing protein [Occallatibacter savannae]